MGRHKKKFIFDEDENGDLILEGWVTGQFHFEDVYYPIRRKLCQINTAFFLRNGRRRSEKQFNKFIEGLYDKKLKQVITEIQNKEKGVKERKDKIYGLLDLWLETVKPFITPKMYNGYALVAEMYKQSVSNHMAKDTNDVVVKPFKEHLQNHISERTKKLLSPTSRYNYFHYLEIFLNWCEKNQYILKAPVLNNFPLPGHKRHSLKPSEIRKLWKHISHIAENGMFLEGVNPITGKFAFTETRFNAHYEKLKIYFMVLLWTGMRIGEVHSLQWKHIDLEKGSINLKYSIDKETQTETFNKAFREDDLPLHPVLWEYIRELKRKLNSQEVYLIDNGEGEPYYKDPGYVSRMFSKIFKKCGIDKKPTHSFRFTLATSLKNAETQIQTAMMLIRHKDQKTLARYEDPTTLEQGREALLKIQNPLSDE